MKELNIFEVKKGSSCGVIYIPRKYIGKKVKVVIMEEKDYSSTIEHRKSFLKKVIAKAEFELNNIEELEEGRINRNAITNEKIGKFKKKI